MPLIRLLVTVASVVSVPAFAADKTPTELPLPPGAEDVGRLSTNGGNSYQTSFTVHPKFPAIPALGMYMTVLDSSWESCTWGSGKWEYFGDDSRTPHVTVHQRLHAWVNRKLHRAMAFAARYYSADHWYHDWPDNDAQHVVMIENFDVDADDYISWMRLSCGKASPSETLQGK